MQFIVNLLVIFGLFSLGAHAASPKTVNLTQITAVNLTAAATAQRVSATDVLCTCAVINALAANTGVIYIGDSAVTAANGFPLQKGDSMVMCSDDPLLFVNLKNIYFDGGTTNDDIKVSCSKTAKISIIPKPF